MRALLVILLLALGACRTVAPVGQIRPTTAPDISRVTLKNGTIVEFDRDFGWYNLQTRTVEGTTVTGDHVEFHLNEISKVENVRAYSLFFAAIVATALGGVAIYFLATLLTLV